MERGVNDTYPEEMTALHEEINELKAKFKENKKELEYLSNLKKPLLSGQGKAVPTHEQIKNTALTELEFVHCKKEIQFFNNISGLTFTKYIKKSETKGDDEILCKHRLVGQCQTLTFQLEFESLDLKSKGGSCCDITNLNIIMGCSEHLDLSKFISRMEEKKSLMAFFSTLSNFADWGDYRKHIFVQFKEKYPSAVGLPVGSSGIYMVLRNPKLPGSELLLVWKMEIDKKGEVIPILDLLPKIPEQALALDKLRVIENAATNFKCLLQVYGIERSIENLIQVFCLTGKEDNQM